MRRIVLSFSVLILLIVLLMPSAILAQAPAKAEKELMSTNYLGDILTAPTPNPARMHVQGGINIQSADYYRGRFSGIPESGDRWGALPYLFATAEVFKNDQAMLRSMNVTVGTWNGLGETNNFPDAHAPKSWYKSHNWASLSSNVGADWKAAVTYTGLTSPNGQFASAEEVSMATRYAGPGLTGMLAPQLKVAVPFSGGKGVYLEGSIKPTVYKHPDFKIDLPVIFGAGLGDYYGQSEDNLVYLQMGAVGTVPLKFIPAPDYGAWNLQLSLYGIIREHELSQFSRFDDAGNSVIYGVIGINFTF